MYTCISVKSNLGVLILDSMVHFCPALVCSSFQTHTNQSHPSLHTIIFFLQPTPDKVLGPRDLWGSHLYHWKGLRQLPGHRSQGFAYHVQRKENPLRNDTEAK